MADLRKVIVEFDKNKKNGRVYISFVPELLEHQDRLALLTKVKEGAELVTVKDGFSWSSLFKVVGVPFYHSGHLWLEFELDLLRVNKPVEWSEEHYEDQINLHVRHLCLAVKYQIDSLEEDLLQSKLPEVRWSTSQL